MESEEMKNDKVEKSRYGKFAIMMGTSFIIMYAVMFRNADVFDHVILSHTRTYIKILMVAPMAFTMLLFMWGMNTSKRLNFIILGFSVIIFIITLVGLRQQTFIGDEQWMKAMIPHHSFAIMVSRKALLKDPKAIKLAEEIIEAQEREIAKMKKMIHRLERSNE
jgi:cell division protein FtsW (lipid II flippase)